jgi:hypothetical protein
LTIENYYNNGVVVFTRQHFVISILSLVLSLSVCEECSDMVLMLRHPLEHSELHVNLSLVSHIEELFEEDAAFEKL